jgi:hypothetical protein
VFPLTLIYKTRQDTAKLELQGSEREELNQWFPDHIPYRCAAAFSVGQMRPYALQQNSLIVLLRFHLIRVFLSKEIFEN